MESLLSEAESLRLSVLQILTSSLGECHLRTSSFYINLGGLYQVKSGPFSGDPLSIVISRFASHFPRISSHNFLVQTMMLKEIRKDEMYKKAERMFLQAIQIRESLSGTEDYLVKI